MRNRISSSNRINKIEKRNPELLESFRLRFVIERKKSINSGQVNLMTFLYVLICL